MKIATELKLPRNCSFEENDWKVLARQWHPVAYSDEVEDEGIARVLLDEELIIYRTSNRQVVVAKDLCIHRGVPLRLGRKEGDEMVCAYHGFRYAADGRCTSVPAMPELVPPKKLCLFTYPTVERYGIIWTQLLPNDEATLPEWPELEDASFRMLHDPAPVWNSSAGRIMENALDVVHFAWIHGDTFGDRDNPVVQPYEVERTEHGMHVEYPYLASNPSDSPVKDGSDAHKIQRWMVYDVHLPFASRLQVDYGEGHMHCLFDLASPVSLTKTRFFYFLARNFDHHVEARTLLDWEKKILMEDKDIVENQRPEELPLDLTEEFHLRIDRTSTVYRKGLAAMGLGRTYTT